MQTSPNPGQQFSSPTKHGMSQALEVKWLAGTSLRAVESLFPHQVCFWNCQKCIPLQLKVTQVLDQEQPWLAKPLKTFFFLVWWLHFLLMSCSKTLGCRNNKYRLLYDHSLPWDASEIPLAMEVKDLRPCTSTRHPQFIPTSQLGLPGLSNSFPCHLIKLATK